MPRVFGVIVTYVVLGTALFTAWHASQYGFNAAQAAMAFFLVVNSMIAIWELCLYFQIDFIRQQFAKLKLTYRGRELQRVGELFNTSLTWAAVVSPHTWAQIWATYSLFDESYSDTKSYGFWIDSGNGFTTLPASLLCLAGMTSGRVPSSSPSVATMAFGLLYFVANYQMFYGTVLYFASYITNRRYEGHSLMNVVVFVGVSNLIWMIFPLFGMWAGWQVLNEHSMAVFRN